MTTAEILERLNEMIDSADCPDDREVLIEAHNLIKGNVGSTSEGSYPDW